MENFHEINNVITHLINKNLSETISEIEVLPESGSSRSYFRIHCPNNTYIATYNPNIEENNAFFSFSADFIKKNLPVPEVLAISDDKTCYIQSDLGNKSLYDYVQKCVKENCYDDETISLYKKAISKLADFQIRGNHNLDYTIAYPCSSFNRNSIIDDLNYFKYYFLKTNDEIIFNETRLNTDFQNIASYISEAPSEFFMYRDFQSRNIMIKDNNAFFIDYQGGRKGPLQYDIVSLLFQVKAQLPDNLKNELLGYYKEQLERYINIETVSFDKYYTSFVLLRLLQVLGAYGFRGLIQKKQHFLESIPFALKEIISLKDNLDFPFEINELSSVLSQMSILLPKYEHIDKDRLTVTVNSFSYKKGGIPEDRSGNGGGFVFDCRALPNPGRYKEYQSLTGRDAEVQKFLDEKESVNKYFELTSNVVFMSVDNYLERDFKNLFVSFGCTGGQHRSVYFAQKIAECLHMKYPQIRVLLNHIAQNISYEYDAD